MNLFTNIKNKITTPAKGDNNLENIKWFVATVEDNNDSKNKSGKVRIRVHPFMDDFPTSFLPLARPRVSFLGGSESWGEAKIPPNKSKIWVYSEDTLLRKVWYYSNALSTDTLNIFKKWESSLQFKLGASGSYPDVHFTLYPNGIAQGVCISNNAKEIFTYHPSGTYWIIKNDGSMDMEVSDDFNLNISGDLNATIEGDCNLEVDGDCIVDATNIELNGNSGDVVTTETAPVIDLITGTPHVGSSTVKAGS